MYPQKYSLKFKFHAEAQYIFGTCTMTFTAYNSAGEALYSWTEYRQAIAMSNVWIWD
ncbi:TPA: hypothetical protein NEG48_003279 [Elizabethkingia anophelis]|nr:hypothetical protein [Elizabethkingia anophelis]